MIFAIKFKRLKRGLFRPPEIFSFLSPPFENLMSLFTLSIFQAKEGSNEILTTLNQFAAEGYINGLSYLTSDRYIINKQMFF